MKMIKFLKLFLLFFFPFIFNSFASAVRVSNFPFLLHVLPKPMTPNFHYVQFRQRDTKANDNRYPFLKTIPIGKNQDG